MKLLLWYGSDNLKTLDTWKEVETLLSSYKIYVLKRDKDDIDEIIKSNQLLKEHKKAFHTLSREVNSNLSSTYVRNKIKEGKSIKYLTPHEVVNYILKNELYQ